MFKKTMIALSVVLSIGLNVAEANEKDIKEKLSNFSKDLNAKITSVNKTSFESLYEVTTESGDIFYTNKNAEFVIWGGDLLDYKNKKSITQERKANMKFIDWSSLNLNNAIVDKRGEGNRKMAVFADPNCGYCKKLETELAGMANVTIYTFLIPMFGEESKTKSTNIWCSKDKLAVWNNWVLKNIDPPKTENCKNPIQENMALAQKLGIKGTPTIFFENGTKVPGFMQAKALEEKLNTSSFKK